MLLSSQPPGSDPTNKVAQEPRGEERGSEVKPLEEQAVVRGFGGSHWGIEVMGWATFLELIKRGEEWTLGFRFLGFVCMYTAALNSPRDRWGSLAGKPIIHIPCGLFKRTRFGS